MRKSKAYQPFLASAGLAAALLAGLLHAAEEASSGDKQQASQKSGEPYTVKNCQEDKGCETNKTAYIGWRTYEGFCLRCHGAGGAGSSLAPSLMARLDGMKKQHFVHVVNNGMEGQVGIMPAWGENPNVNDKIDNLWAWLNAVNDGKLGPGRPERFDDTESKSKHSNWE